MRTDGDDKLDVAVTETATGDAVRAVGDIMAASQVGETSIAEKIDTGSIDVAVRIAGSLLLAEPGGDIHVSTGEVAGTSTHQDQTRQGLEVAGRAWDISKAHRHLVRTPAHAGFTVVALWRGRSQRTELRGQLVLAFEATSYVMWFCLVARVLWHVAVALAQLLGRCVYNLTGFTPSFPALGAAFTFPVDRSPVVVANMLVRSSSISDSVCGTLSPTSFIRKVATTSRGTLRFEARADRSDKIMCFKRRTSG